MNIYKSRFTSIKSKCEEGGFVFLFLSFFIILPKYFFSPTALVFFQVNKGFIANLTGWLMETSCFPTEANIRTCSRKNYSSANLFNRHRKRGLNSTG